MTVYIVSRHPGAVEWIRRALGAADAVVLAHVESLACRPGDIVAGVLPLWLAAHACSQGARALALDVDLAPGQRGRELSAAELSAANARLVDYDVRQRP